MVLRSKQHVDRVIVVDDGSDDATAEVAALSGAEVIRHPENKGKGGALKTGFAAASGADIIVIMDTDGQHNPAEIPVLVAPILSGEADIVNGSRYLDGKDRNTPVYRRVGQKVLDTFLNINSRLDITDTQSGFRAFAGSAVPAFKFRQNGLGIESEMLADAAKAGLRVKVLYDMELRRPLYYFTVPGMVVRTTGPGKGLNIVNAKCQGYDHGS